MYSLKVKNIPEENIQEKHKMKMNQIVKVLKKIVKKKNKRNCYDFKVSRTPSVHRHQVIVPMLSSALQ